jgi:hypothetical protein
MVSISQCGEYSSQLYYFLSIQLWIKIGPTRTVITLVDLLEMDYLEAAHTLQISIGTVKSRLSRARLQVKAKLAAIPEYGRADQSGNGKKMTPRREYA